LILDEPTSSLNERDSEALLDLLVELKTREGLTAILISHKLNEVSRVADSLTVLRDGTTVASRDMSDTSYGEGEIIRDMVGRSMSDRYPPRRPRIGDTVMEVADWRVHHPTHQGRLVVRGVNFHLRRGEVLGIAGLMGAGRTELAMSLFGRSYGQGISGTVRIHGR
ncbi:MAG TPA: ABC transporter ATP-binding protein, partial [Tistrella mobilis]|nr:ABC transporter ATP-binding protein [Tistrella mobilis]